MKLTQSKIRDLMPDEYGNILSERTGATRQHIYDVVNKEKTRAKIWPAVLTLAEETVAERRKEQERLIRLKSVA